MQAEREKRTLDSFELDIVIFPYLFLADMKSSQTL